LGNAQLFRKSIIDGWVHYTIKREDLDKMLKIKGFDKYLTIPHLTTLKNTNVTNNTNSTNNTISNSLTDNQEVEISEVSEVGSVKSIQGGLE